MCIRDSVKGARGAGPLAIDAGSLGLVGEADHMGCVREVLLTHAHIDHIATLPMWIEGVLSLDRAPVRIHGTRETIAALRAHLFNDVLYPNFEQLSDSRGRQLLEYGEVPTDSSFSLAGFTIQAFQTNHPIPTHGYALDDGDNAVVFAADGGPSDALWNAVRSCPRVRAVVLETSFPDALLHIAEGSGHMTPALLRAELEKAPKDLRILVCHLKPAHREGITRLLKAARDPRIELFLPGTQVEIR